MKRKYIEVHFHDEVMHPSVEIRSSDIGNERFIAKAKYIFIDPLRVLLKAGQKYKKNRYKKGVLTWEKRKKVLLTRTGIHLGKDALKN
ncbi:hypothetical protein [Butyrivibrio sp. AC2005]|uniref:hypothetical protein n=1 Tax=Butyrivibrio sp. AC2005 TaxID=1280672 RepID=UPI0004179F3E|nr:hypothetical protein [Butyrivibrio sp. AC2005]